MKEDLLHYIWNYKKIPLQGLQTTSGEPISILDMGMANHLAGPDFLNAKIRINNQLWVGNVEMHIKSSDWYRHNHEKDANYDAVILHVVWEDDVPVFGGKGFIIPTLTLQGVIAPQLLQSYQHLVENKDKNFINCENQIKETSSFLLDNWWERLFLERLERKSSYVLELLEASKNNWEQVMFILLLKSFGLNNNGGAFAAVGETLPYTVVRKVQNDVFKVESLLFGTAGLLQDTVVVDDYFKRLYAEYLFLKNKFGLQVQTGEPPQFFRLRPANFPTIRLSQLANLVVQHPNLFHEVMQGKSPREFYTLFAVAASSYWRTHYTFGQKSKETPKGLTPRFVDSIILNAVLPLQFCYAKYLGNDVNESILGLATQLKKETNHIVQNFEAHGVAIKNAKEGQAALTLYHSYCTKNKCLQCSIGSSMLSANNYL
ncbi:DUF2851 family protein [Arenibacter sp. GZD96]|uniref:DUF2851 family protein n=1 Tax=Aurantibrevibacter litoralis TaxID=3106030 RepID=UPI002AFF64B2|nr:DUF2851 family protein [Arenibacter sp. GZD-96]MEA1786812.1 DUF2851 family protein [Arenibacter sp. GZD-96]